MNKFGVERTPLAQNSKMVQKLDLLKFWGPGMKSNACAITRFARLFRLFGSLHYTEQGIIA